MLNDLNWPTLASRRKRARLTALYKYRHGLTTINTKHPPTNDARRSKRHSHELSLDIPHSGCEYRRMSFFPRTIPEWNSLPADTALAPSLAAFQARVALLQ